MLVQFLFPSDYRTHYSLPGAASIAVEIGQNVRLYSVLEATTNQVNTNLGRAHENTGVAYFDFLLTLSLRPFHPPRLRHVFPAQLQYHSSTKTIAQHQ